MQRFRAVLAAASLLVCASPIVLEDVGPDTGDYALARRSNRGATVRRGKHKPRRHGQKLKSCRVKIGRRVRRKHRRARLAA